MPFQGALDEIRIWNTTKTQCEINTFMSCEIPTTAANLVANYHFNQGVASGTNSGVTTLSDFSSNAANGTLYNFALTGSASNWISPGAVVNGFTTALGNAVGITVSNSVICRGQPVTLSVAGANLTYTWTGGVVNGASFSPTATAGYSVSGTNSLTSCGNSASVSITVNALPTVAVNSGSICSGKTFTMSPTGALTYTFSGGAGVVAPTSNTSYSVTGSNSLGCISASPAVSNVTVVALPVVSVNSGSICGGTSFTMVPSGALTYTFSNGGSVVAPTANSSYSVTGTSAAGCVNSPAAISNVTVVPLPVITVNSGSVCAGQFFIMSPSGASSYTFSNGSAVALPSSNSSYSVLGTNVQGCVSAFPAVSTVTVLPLPVVTVNSGSVCSGTSFFMTPSGASTYTFSNGSPVVAPLATTSYSVIGASAAGCISTPAVSNVTVVALPVISVNSGSICNGQSFTMSPAGAASYTFSSGNPVVSPTANATYFVTGSNVDGCVSASPAMSTVSVISRPVISVNSGSICSGKSFTLLPAGAITYSFANGNPIVSPLANSSYTVFGINLQGCMSASPAISNITVVALPVVSVNSGSICKGASFTIQPSGALSYTFSSGSTVVTPNTTSSYSVTGTNLAGCINFPPAISAITVKELPVLVTISSNSVSCAGDPVTLNVNGALIYKWDNVISGASIVVSPTATVIYTISGTDINGCENTTTITQSVGVCTGMVILIQNRAGISVYPNPGRGVFTLELPTEAKVTIVDLQGTIVFSQYLQEGKQVLDLNDIRQGLYIVRCESNGAFTTLRLVKE